MKLKWEKQQVAAIHSNCIVGHENKNQTQDSRQTQDPGKSLALIKSIYFPWKSFKIINLFLTLFISNRFWIRFLTYRTSAVTGLHDSALPLFRKYTNFAILILQYLQDCLIMGIRLHSNVFNNVALAYIKQEVQGLQAFAFLS